MTEQHVLSIHCDNHPDYLYATALMPDRYASVGNKVMRGT